MGGQLRRQYNLVTLAIGFEFAGGRSVVRCTLARDQYGERDVMLDSMLEPAALGIPDRLDPKLSLFAGYSFSLPLDVSAALRAAVDAQMLPNEALWLYLKRPFGYLALVPWEQLLLPALERPVLRLPDFLVDPARQVGDYNIALCSSQPVSEEAFAANEYMARLTQMLLQIVGQRLTVHLFTDSSLMPALAGRLQSLGLSGDRVRVYDPQAAAAFAVPDRSSRIADTSGQISSPWLLWMRQAVAPRSMDIVHFIAHGFLAGENAGLSVAESPLENFDVSLPRFIGPNELSAFLVQTGAWGCTISSPPHNYSEMGHRLLTTTLANLRPGPVLHHEMRLDGEQSALADAYRLLLAPGRSLPPASPALILYCHPERVAAPSPGAGAAAAALPEAPPAPDDDPNSAFEAVYAPEDAVPGWVASAMRYLDQRTFEAAQQTDADRGQAVSTTRAAGLEQSATLRKLQTIVAEEARSEAAGRTGGAQ